MKTSLRYKSTESIDINFELFNNITELNNEVNRYKRLKQMFFDYLKIESFEINYNINECYGISLLDIKQAISEKYPEDVTENIINLYENEISKLIKFSKILHSEELK